MVFLNKLLRNAEIKNNLLIKKFSLTALLLIVLWSGLNSFSRWGNVLSWDYFGYYLYTPAFIIWEDPGLENFEKVEEINAKYNNTPSYYQISKTEKGSWMIKYTMGAAVLEAPFFFAAHFLSPSLGYANDGFSLPYQRAMIISHYFYIIIGFVFLRKVLIKYFSEFISGLTLLLLVFGTNYFASAITGPSIHTLEFSLFALILYLTIKWHEEPSLIVAGFLGLMVGFSILVRPTDGIIILIPVLWNIKTPKEFYRKFEEISKNRKRDIFMFLGMCFCVVFLQLAYWKEVSGSWLLMSYNNNPGEGFEFFHPYIMEVLFSFRKGWLLYTPIMLFALLGLCLFFISKHRAKQVGVVLFFILNIYIVSSWTCWWYADSFGQRAIVESYAVLSLPFGVFLSSALMQKKIIKWTILLFCFLLVLLNLFQTWQFTNGIIDGSRMTPDYYFKTFGKTQVPHDAKDLLLVDRSQSGFEKFQPDNKYSKRIIFFDDFEVSIDGYKEQFVDSVFRSGKQSFRLDSSHVFSPKNELEYSLITQKDHAWIRTTFWFKQSANPNENPLGLVVAFTNKNGDAYKYSCVEVGTRPGDMIEIGYWNKYVFDYLTPEVRSKSDRINIYFWFRGKTPVFIDDFKVEAFERNEK